MTVVTDAYALGHDVVLEEEQVSVCVASAKAKGQVPVREQVSVPLEEQTSKVLSCFANACAARATAEQDKICIDTVAVSYTHLEEELEKEEGPAQPSFEEEAKAMTAQESVLEAGALRGSQIRETPMSETQERCV